MDDTKVLGQLEAVAHKLGVQIRYESPAGKDPFFSGGICRLRGTRFIIVNRDASTRQKVEILAKALRRFDLNNMYIRPALRHFLENPGGDAGDDPNQ